MIPLKERSLCLIPGFQHPHKGGEMGLKHPQGPEHDLDGPTELQDMENSNPRDISRCANGTWNAAGTATRGHRDLVGTGSAVISKSSGRV